MWYFTWILGVGFAVLLAVLNGMWHEAQEDRMTIANNKDGCDKSKLDNTEHKEIVL
jgi:cytochrome bd-I ubiquinol oxidase subunit X